MILNKRLVSRGGRDAPNVYEMTWESTTPSAEDMMEAQRVLGFHPGGYGFPERITFYYNETPRRVTWESLGSCD